MQFDPHKVTFGRHESFALRFGWLTKGFQALLADGDIFRRDEATVTLGVGKNMVHSIKYWLRATQVCTMNREHGILPTEIGSAIFEGKGWDPYLEDEATIWLIHWLLATNYKEATAWYWFFNCFHKPEFKSKEAAASISDFGKDNIETKFSVTSAKQDVAVLLRMYTQSKGSTKIPAEEALDSPLSILKLISYSSALKAYTSELSSRESLPIGILGYAISDLLINRGINEIPIEDLMYSRSYHVAPGSVFRLTENGLLTKLEQLVHYIPETFKIDDTAGIHQLYCLRAINPFEYLVKHYSEIIQENAA